MSSGGIITNYHCSASCRHCLYRSGPSRDKSYMTEETLRRLLRKGAELGCRSYHIGGGEPLLNRQGLYRTLEIMAEEEVTVDYLETNASWYKDQESAEKVIDELAARGCTTVMISVCPFHNEFIPLAKMEGVIEACQKRDMPFFIWQEQYYRHLAALDRNRTHSFEEMSHTWGKNYLLNTGKRFGLRMNGRALESYRPFMPHFRAQEIIGDNPGPCTETEETDHFHFDLYGNFIPPGCVGLQVRCSDLGGELPTEFYPHYTLLRDGGIRAYYEFALTRGYTDEEMGYVSKCDLCGRINRFILENSPSPSFRDLGPAEYYTER